MLLQDVPNGLLPSRATAPSSTLRAATSLPQGGPAGAVGSRRAGRPNFVVRRTSASCNLTVGSWECRQAATGHERPSKRTGEESGSGGRLPIDLPDVRLI